MAEKIKKVAIIGSCGLPPRYGGFETLAECLVINQKDFFSFKVFCSSRVYQDKVKDYHGAELIYLPFNANGIQSILYDIVSILHSISRSDCLLILGVSGCIILPFVRLFSGKNIIVNIDGMEWKRDKWNRLAKLFLKFSEVCAVRYATSVVVDNLEIKKFIKDKYGVDSVLIEYAGDHAVKIGMQDYLNEFHFLNERYAFSVCRIEPENNIHIILNAFSKIDDLQCVIVGNWDNSIYGGDLKAQYRDYKNIFLIDAIYDQHKLNALRSNCYVYIHGHSAGGTNPSLVEAMSLGLPVIAYDVPFNRATTEGKAIYFKDGEELIAKIKDFDSQTAAKLSSDMNEIARRRYTWDIITQKYSALFR